MSNKTAIEIETDASIEDILLGLARIFDEADDLPSDTTIEVSFTEGNAEFNVSIKRKSK